jgi:hypothetical protein
MATTPTTNKSKSKKPLPVKFEDDSILGAPIQDEILKRIGEQAKDWEETPRAARREPASGKTMKATANSASKQAATGLPAWTLAALAILFLALGASIVWLNGRTIALEKALIASNAAVNGLTGKIDEMQASMADTQTQVQTMSDAFAAAASARAAKLVAKPNPAATPPAAQNSPIKTK